MNDRNKPGESIHHSSFTTHNSLVPRLRFPEFREAGEWDQKIIEDFFEVGSSKRVLQQEWTTRGVPFYRTRELVSLSKNETFGSEIFISEELFYEISEKYGSPAEGDFLVSGVGTLGICYQVQPGDRIYFKDGNVLWFKLKGGIIPFFFKHAFQADEIQNQILGQASISTVGTYTIQNAKATKITLPKKIEEQQKIADCLSSLDALIAAQTDKIDALKTHKKGLMQQLFPREGETTPRLRFPEFRDAGEWELKTLGKVCDMQAGKFVRASDIKNENVSGLYPCYGGNGLRGYTKTYTHAGKYSLIGRQGALCGNVTLATDRFHATEHAVVVTPNRGVSTVWLFYVLAYLNLNQFATGQAQPGLSVDNLRNVEFWHTDEEKEQQKIADCLSSLDTLIAAQSEKLDALKTHKKGLMQQLFPVQESG